ncbi:MAG: FtsW/RodA/SpoVE family cell cycle protein [Chloroflexota bacterium]
MGLSRAVALWEDRGLVLRREREGKRDRTELMLLAFAAVFIFVNGLAFSLVEAGELTWPHLWPLLVWLLATLGFHLCLRYLKPARDPFLLPIAALLSGWGLLLIDRLAPNFLGRQVLWVVLAYAVSIVIAVWPRSLMPLIRYRYTLLTISLALLAMTLLFGVNPSGGGARLWLPIPIPFIETRIYFQPSELLKVIMVIFFASYFTEREPQLRYRNPAAKRSNRTLLERIAANAPFLGPLLLVWGFCMVLLVWQEDLGAASLFFILFLALLYVATGQKKLCDRRLAPAGSSQRLCLYRLWRCGRSTGNHLVESLAPGQ